MLVYVPFSSWPIEIEPVPPAPPITLPIELFPPFAVIVPCLILDL